MMRSSLAPLIAFVLVAGCHSSPPAAPPDAQATPADSAAHAHHASAPHPVALHPGLGDARVPISTQDELAQAFFDQGMALLYGFNHDEAARSFRRASELDPDAAMPYWGLALAIGPNYNDTAVDAGR